MTLPKIGFVTCIHPTCVLPSAIQTRDKAIAALRDAGCEVVVPEIVRSPQDIPKLTSELKSGEIDLLLFFFCTWVDEEVTLFIAQELKTVPLLLWALPYFDLTTPMLSPVTGLTTTGCNLRGVGRSFLHQIGGVTPDRIREIERCAGIASAVRRLRNARFGIFGQHCPGMLDTDCNDSLVQKFLGVTTVRMLVEDALKARDAASEEDARQMAQRLKMKTGRTEVSLDVIANQCRMALGMKALIREHGLDGFAVRCWPELRDQNKNPICLAMAELADSGIASSCAADLTALITSYVLTCLTGQPSATLEITAYLEEQNALQFAHCGSAAVSLARDQKSTVIRGHMRTGTGAVIEFPFKARPVTLAKILRPSESGMKMFVARGEVIPANNSAARGTVATVRVEPSPEQFIDSMLSYKVEHHLVLAYGDWSDDLAKFAQLAGMDCIYP